MNLHQLLDIFGMYIQVMQDELLTHSTSLSQNRVNCPIRLKSPSGCDKLIESPTMRHLLLFSCQYDSNIILIKVMREYFFHKYTESYQDLIYKTL